jgi:hypothetical protein
MRVKILNRDSFSVGVESKKRLGEFSSWWDVSKRCLGLKGLIRRGMMGLRLAVKSPNRTVIHVRCEDVVSRA